MDHTTCSMIDLKKLFYPLHLREVIHYLMKFPAQRVKSTDWEIVTLILIVLRPSPSARAANARLVKEDLQSSMSSTAILQQRKINRRGFTEGQPAEIGLERENEP